MSTPSSARNKRVRCEIAEVRALGPTGVPVVLGVPTTYMNLSGDPVQSAAAWFKVPPERTIVVHDDLDVPVGGLKLKRGGGHAGHNGLKDIDRALGTREYVRVRIGVGRPPGRMPGKDYVLRRPSPADAGQLDVVLEEAADALAMVVTEGLEADPEPLPLPLTPGRRRTVRDRIRQLGAAWRQLRELDPNAIWFTLLGAVVGALVGAGLGLLIHWIAAIVFGLLFAFTGGLLVFSRRVQKAQFAAIEGQPGAAAAVLNVMRGQWFVTPAVAFTAKQDLVHRVVGRPGVDPRRRGLPAADQGVARQGAQAPVAGRG